MVTNIPQTNLLNKNDFVKELSEIITFEQHLVCRGGGAIVARLKWVLEELLLLVEIIIQVTSWVERKGCFNFVRSSSGVKLVFAFNNAIMSTVHCFELHYYLPINISVSGVKY
jgi:hypothetical protein